MHTDSSRGSRSRYEKSLYSRSLRYDDLERAMEMTIKGASKNNKKKENEEESKKGLASAREMG